MTFLEFKAAFQKVPPIEHVNDVTETPFVSVCVQAYHHASFIRSCLDSILMQQTVFSFEILLGEDESNDGTRDICIEYANKFPEKIRLFLHRRENNIHVNGTPTGRFNFINNLFSAKGKYIAICEGDDYWIDPLKLQKQVNFLEANPSFTISFHDVNYLTSGKGPERSKLYDNLHTDSITIQDLANGLITIHTPSVLFRNILNSNILKRMVGLPIGDYPLWLFLAGQGDLHLHREIMAVYRIHQGGLWSRKKEAEKDLALIETIKGIKDDFNGEVQAALDTRIINLYQKALQNSLQEPILFDKVFFEFLTYTPSSAAESLRQSMLENGEFKKFKRKSRLFKLIEALQKVQRFIKVSR